MKTYLGSLVARERGSVGAITPRLIKWYEPAPRRVAVLPTFAPEPAPFVSRPRAITQSPIVRAASRPPTPEASPTIRARAVPVSDRGARVSGEPPRLLEADAAMAPDQAPRAAPTSAQPSSAFSVAAPFLPGKLRSVRPATRAPAPALAPTPAPEQRDAGVTRAVPSGPRQSDGHPAADGHPPQELGSLGVEPRAEGQALRTPIGAQLVPIRPRQQPVSQIDPDQVSSGERPVQVTIGKVEIRAVQQIIGRAAPASVPPPMPLDEYLRRRSGDDR